MAELDRHNLPLILALILSAIERKKIYTYCHIKLFRRTKNFSKMKQKCAQLHMLRENKSRDRAYTNIHVHIDGNTIRNAYLFSVKYHKKLIKQLGRIYL